MEVSSFLHHTCTRVERNKIMQVVREKAPGKKKKKKKEKKKTPLAKTVQVCIKNNTTTKKQHQQQNQPPMSNKEEERRRRRRRCGRVRERERDNRPNCSLSTALHLDGKVDKNFFFSFAAAAADLQQEIWVKSEI
jgi:hypothetical protein